MRSNVAIIDFGTSKIVTMVADTSGRQRCDIIGTGTAEYEGFSGGGWNASANLELAIRKSVDIAAEQAKYTIRTLYVGVPGEFSRVYPVEVSISLQGTDPRVTMQDVDILLDKANAELGEVRGLIIHRSPAWFVVDNGKKTLEPMGMKGRELRALISFVVADQCFCDEINAKLKTLQIKNGGFFSSATGEATLFLPSNERDHTAFLIDIGYLNTDVMAVEGDALVYLKTIPVGGAHIALDLTYGLRTQMNTAEQIKREYVFGVAAPQTSFKITVEGGETHEVLRSAVAEILEPRVDELAELILNCIEQSHVTLSNTSSFYLTGGGLSLNRNGRDHLASQMHLTVRELPKKTTKLNSPVYSSSLGTLDLVIDTITRNRTPASGLWGSIKEFFSNLLGG